MKTANLVGYALLALGIALRLFVPSLGLVGTLLAAAGGLAVAIGTVASANKGRR